MERMFKLQTRWRTALRRFCISQAAQAAKAWTLPQSSTVQLTRNSECVHAARRSSLYANNT